MKASTDNMRSRFSTKPLAAAVALALVTPVALADNGMPGAGLVVRNIGNVTVNTIALPGGNQIIGLNNGATIESKFTGQNTVIQWGSPAVLDTANKAGFNIAAGKTLNFVNTGAIDVAVLNIDISGAMSMIDGKIVADANTYVVVANEKGVTIGSGATITAPYGFAATGVKMNTIDAINTFASLGYVQQMNFAAGAPVSVLGDVSGVGRVLMVAGSTAVNLSPTKAPGAGVPIYVVGGVGSDFDSFFPPVANDKGAPSTTVRSSAATDVTIGLGKTATPFDVAGSPLTVWANGNLTNTGALDFKATPVTTALQWTGKLTNSGTLTTTTAATGIDINIDGSTVGWYNNTASLAKFGQGGLVNSGTISAPDGFVNVELDNGPIDNSGTISAKGYVDLEVLTGAGAITNSGTVTSATSSIYVYAEDGNVTNSGTMSADGYVYLEAYSILEANQHNVVNSGKLTSAKSYVSIYSDYGSVTNTASGVVTGTSAYFYANYGTGALPGHNTNAGTVNITSKGGEVQFFNYGSGDITIGGTIQATGAGNYIGYFSAAHYTDAKGLTKIDTPIAVMADKGNYGIYVAGEKVLINAPMMVSEATPGAGAGIFEVYGTNSVGANHTHVNADLTAGEFLFSTYNGGGATGSPFDMSIALDGDITTTVGGARTVEMYDVSSVIGPGVITANHVVFDTSGSLRNPVSNNYLLNGLHITTVGTNPLIEVTARSPGVQTVNLAITGDATVTSGQTVIVQQPCYSGLCIVPSGGYIPQPNAGSNLLITATGNISVGANNVAGNFLGGGFGGLSATNGFLFPGSVVFVAGGALNVNTVVDNAFTGTAAPFQGVFFEGATINAMLPIYTNGNSFVNYSVRPNGGVGLSTVYNAKAGTNFLGFANLTAVANPLGSFLNSYTVLANALAAGEPWLPLVNTTPFTQ